MLHTILLILLSLFGLTFLLVFVFEGDLRFGKTGKVYNERRKNPNRAYAAVGTPITDRIYALAKLRNICMVTSVILFILTGITAIILAL